MTSGRAGGRPTTSVVIPAHNEGRVIVQTLTSLLIDVRPGELDVVVVCNGCTDDTAARAREFERRLAGVRVVEIQEASKQRAVEAGNAVTSVFPRVHLDADVEIRGSDVMALAEAVRCGPVLAAGPTRRLPLTRSSWLVRSYYRVWEALPAVRQGLFGRGVIALSAEGQARVDALPRIMGDDLAISEAFEPHEAAVVASASVVVYPPRTVADLVRRRVHVVTGNAAAGGLALRRSSSITRPATLLALALGDPALAARMPAFLLVTLLARRHAARALRGGGAPTWLRDESSRSLEGRAHA